MADTFVMQDSIFDSLMCRCLHDEVELAESSAAAEMRQRWILFKGSRQAEHVASLRTQLVSKMASLH
ncbi:hypothetical protein JI59_22425 (plasmid) [Novosphingobium pentaromativorans US6-1]|nr:hypothetical protein JI59_22425 [Novosphingobium pentaromativorans US6-1]